MEFVGTTWVPTLSSVSSFLILSSFIINYSLQHFNIMYQCLHPLSVICPNCPVKLNFWKGSPPFLHQWILSSVSVAPNLSSSLCCWMKHTLSLSHWTMTPWDYTLNSWVHPSMYYICHLYFSFMCIYSPCEKAFCCCFLRQNFIVQLWSLSWNRDLSVD